MPRKKIIDDKIEKAIEEILANAGYSMSIREVTKTLKDKYNIKRSPQIVLRHLERLKKDDIIIEK